MFRITLFVRPFSSCDIVLRGYDEVWKACIMLVLALTYSVTLLGRWSRFKDWANVSDVRSLGGFGAYAVGQALLALVIFPGLYCLSIRTAKWYAGADTIPPQRTLPQIRLCAGAYGLAGMDCFQRSADDGQRLLHYCGRLGPAGLGMNLFGTADFPVAAAEYRWQTRG